MNLQETHLLIALIFSLCQLLRGQSSYCNAVDAVIQNANTDELTCQAQDSCSRLECRNRNSQLGSVVDLFDIRLLPCAEPSPTVWIQLLGEQDFVNEGRRRLQLNATLTQTDGEADYTVVINGLPFGTYHFTVNVSNSSSTIGISAQLVGDSGAVTTTIIDYTELEFDPSICSAQTATTTTTELATPETSILNDSMSSTSGAMGVTPTSMNSDTFLLGASLDLQPRTLLVLNFILVCVTLVAVIAT